MCASKDPGRQGIDADPTVTDDDLADQSCDDDRRVPPEPYPSGDRTRTICRQIVRGSLVSFAVLAIPLLLAGGMCHGGQGMWGVAFGLLTVIFFCLSTPAAMSLLASNRLNSRGRMGGYVRALALFIVVKVLVFVLVWILVMDDDWFSRPMFLLSAVLAGVVYLIVVSVAIVRSNRGHADKSPAHKGPARR